MAVSYKKLWKLLIDKDMKKKELEEQAKVSHYGRGEPRQERLRLNKQEKI